jgi:hypothetical protein
MPFVTLVSLLVVGVVAVVLAAVTWVLRRRRRAAVRALERAAELDVPREPDSVGTDDSAPPAPTLGDRHAAAPPWPGVPGVIV